MDQPSVWPDGHIKGLKARGGFEVDIYWKDGQLKQADILSKAGSRCILVYKDKSIGLETEKGKSYKLSMNLKN